MKIDLRCLRSAHGLIMLNSFAKFVKILLHVAVLKLWNGKDLLQTDRRTDLQKTICSLRDGGRGKQ